jgi:O-antigen/teichoic acid export membrane protein
VPGYLERLARTGLAYQLGDIVAKVLALALLPVYTRHLTRADYGTAELLLSLVIAASIVIRLGVVEAFVRHWYLDEDPERRAHLARTTWRFLLVGTTVAAAAVALLAGPLSELILGRHDPGPVRAAALGLWAFSNLELAGANLRVEERARDYLLASLANVALTVGLTVWFVVGRDMGAEGLLLGNYLASAAVVVALWVLLRDRLLPARAAGGRAATGRLADLLRFGAPLVPAEVSVFALNVVDRAWIYGQEGASAAGLYSLAVKLAAAMVILTRMLQYAWPPIAYSIEDDVEAARVYASVATYYALIAGIAVAGFTLLGRQVLAIFAAPAFRDAYEALPWVALGWALYGLVVVLTVTTGRAQATARNVPAALAGLAVNVVLLALLVPPLGIAGAGIALCGSYVVMVAVLYAMARRAFAVPFEWGRLARIAGVVGVVAAGGETLLPTEGVDGALLRATALAAIVPLLWLAGFFHPEEIRRLRALLARARRTRA